MSIKSKVLAAAATLTMVGGVGTVGVLTAGTARRPPRRAAPPASTSSAEQFGTHGTPNFMVDVLRQGAKVGQPIILFRTSNSDPALDWTRRFQGTVADFYAAGLVSAAVACTTERWHDFPALRLPDRYDPAFENRVRAVRRGQRPVRRRRRHRHPGRGRDAAAVRRVRPRPCGSWDTATRPARSATATSR